MDESLLDESAVRAEELVIDLACVLAVGGLGVAMSTFCDLTCHTVQRSRVRSGTNGNRITELVASAVPQT